MADIKKVDIMKKNYLLLFALMLIGICQSWAQEAEELTPVVDTLNFNKIVVPEHIEYIKEDKVFEQDAFIATVSPKESGLDDNCLWDDLVFGTQLRFYSGTMTIEAKEGHQITRLEVIYDDNFGMTADCGKFDGNIWTNDTSEPITKVTLTASKYNRLNKIFIGEHPLVLQSIEPTEYVKNYTSMEKLPEEVVFNFQCEPYEVAYAQVAKHATLRKIDKTPRTDILADAKIEGNSVKINMKNYYEAENPLFYRIYLVVKNKAGVPCKTMHAYYKTETDTINADYFTDISPIAMTPEPGSTNSSLKEFSIWVDKNYNLGGYDHERSVELLNEQKQTVCMGKVKWDDAEFNRLNITLSEEVTASGNYTLYIPEGMYQSQKAFWVVKNKAMEFPFYIAASEVSIESVTPQSFTETALTMKELPKQIVVETKGEPGSVEFATAVVDGDTENVIDLAPYATFSTNSVTFDLSKLAEQTPAPLYYNIKMKLLDKEGNALAYNKNELITLDYYTDIAIVKANPEDGSSVDKLNEVEFWVDSRYQAGVISQEKQITVVNAADNKEVTTAKMNFHKTDWSCYVIELDKEITEDGTYKIIIPEGMYASNNLDIITNREETLTYTVDSTLGIENITTDSNVITDIYTIDGKLVRKAGESTSGLAKGIYIANGKKIVVR